ncbi:MAG: type V CRISPR-associated protein Cas4 [Flavobacteriales bacterium]
METYLPISYLNDFVFCPYSIYLHQVFDSSREEVYSASPQQVGKTAHNTIDDDKRKQRNEVLSGVYIISNRLGVYGKIDQYFVKEQKLVERKFMLKTIYRGYYYQIWAQYIALEEMGYPVDSLFFHSIKNNNRIRVAKPTKEEVEELRQHIRKIARFDFETQLNVNPEKCKHCIYASLCDKTNQDHVYA